MDVSNIPLIGSHEPFGLSDFANIATIVSAVGVLLAVWQLYLATREQAQ
jgi:hypothetical protein